MTDAPRGDLLKVGGHVTRTRNVLLYVTPELWEMRHTTSWRTWAWDMKGLETYADKEPGEYRSGGGWFSPEGMLIVVERRNDVA